MWGDAAGQIGGPRLPFGGIFICPGKPMKPLKLGEGGDEVIGFLSVPRPENVI